MKQSMIYHSAFIICYKRPIQCFCGLTLAKFKFQNGLKHVNKTAWYNKERRSFEKRNLILMNLI